MIDKLLTRPIAATKKGAFRAFLLASLLLPLAATTPVRSVSAGVQPTLLAMAAKSPNSTLKVIVQKSSMDGSAENAIRHIGGTVTKDLYLIHAVGADVPAGRMSELAHAPGVRWVSYDAPVESASGGTTQFTAWATDEAVSAASPIANTFNQNAINPGKYLWLNSALKVSGLGSSPVTVNFDKGSISVSSNGASFTMPVPDATIIYSPGATMATTSYDATNGKWVTTVPSRLGSSNVFLIGLAEQIPTYLPGGLGPLNLSGRFTTDTPGVTVSGWSWGAAVYSSFDTSYTPLGVKPCDDGTASQYHNSDKAGAPENFKTTSIAGGTSAGGTDYTGAYPAMQPATPSVTFNGAANMYDAPKGPNGAYGSGGNVVGSFTGFGREQRPGTRITRLEAVVQAYVPSALSGSDTVRFSVETGGSSVSNVTMPRASFNAHVGQATAGLIYVDMTGARTWNWSDFNNLNLTITQSGFASGHSISYDAVGLRVTTGSGTDTTGGIAPTSLTKNLIDPYKLGNAYNAAVRAPNVWNEYPNYYQGQGTTVAVVDSGVVPNRDLGTRLINGVNFNVAYHDSEDSYGHGTFVAGEIGGDGTLSSGKYIGIAPRTNILNVRVSSDNGGSSESDVVAALQWIYENKATYNIRVVNMSLNSGNAQSYMTSPMDAAAEILWFNGVVVVASAGNNGTATLYPPANDPFVITVGATDDQGTASLADDVRASFSAYGTTEANTPKPDVMAPGANIIGLLPQNDDLKMGHDHADHQINTNYFKMSGTSMSAPIVSGAVALMLQANPTLNPDVVKARLMQSAVKGAGWPAYNATNSGAGYLDVYAAVHSTVTTPANIGLRASQLLWSGGNPVTWQSVNWNSVNWNSVNWNSVNWNSVNWNSVNWNSDFWGTP